MTVSQEYKTDLTWEYVYSLFDYNPISGCLVRRIPTKPNEYGREVGNSSRHGYPQVQIDNKLYFNHRLIWLWNMGEWPKKQIDHINGVRHDNRIVNLREADYVQNRSNSKPLPNKTGYRGVWWNGSRYRAAIMYKGVRYRLGYFSTAIEASNAYEAKARELHGEFYKRVGALNE